MSLEQSATSAERDEQRLDENDYRPSVKLAPHEEIRLLDEALEEAKARPRPPQATYAAPPVPVRPRAIAAAVNPPPSRPQVEHRRGGKRRFVDEDDADAGSFMPDAEAPEERVERPLRKRRIDVADILAFSESSSDSHDGAVDDPGVDRKRLLAAIICILQEELTRGR